ncbi:MAG: hypothetical protein DRO39_08565 [Thermoprotei archaeon]|nr:MAG: hypothetical protein DRO39_08565 [Thermoprotei archaeon]
MIKVEYIKCINPVHVRTDKKTAEKIMQMFHSYLYAEKEDGIIMYMPLTHGQCIEIEYTDN